MILTEKIEITIKNNLRKYYNNLGYKFPPSWDPKIIIDIKDLPKSSNLKINCKCDICGKINSISYCCYNRNIKTGGFYSCKGKCSRMKFKQTCLKKYGFENPFQNEEIKSKSKITLIEKYGVDNSMKLYENKNKSKETCMKHFNSNSYLNTELCKKRIFEIYGVNNVFQSDIIKNKTRETCIRKYGVEYSQQNENIHIKQQISGFHMNKYKDTELHYRGTYELDFLDKYFYMGIIKSPSIKYLFENKNKIYFPDFYYEPLNLIIEIKSDYTFKKYLSKNLQKQKSCLEQGYNFIFIINKNYEEFEKIIF